MEKLGLEAKTPAGEPGEGYIWGIYICKLYIYAAPIYKLRFSSSYNLRNSL